MKNETMRNGRKRAAGSMATNRARAEEGDDVLLSEMAYERIENMIVTGALRPNSMISENELSKELGCGRAPVREALQRLRSIGFVEVLPRRGALVTPVDVRTQLELLEVRRPLAELMVRSAARRASAEERLQMKLLADQLEEAVRIDDRERYFDINRRIHLIEAEAAKNRVLKNSIGVIHSLSRRFWYALIKDTKSFSEAAVWHTHVLRAIADSDAEQAAFGARKLIDFLERVTRATIEDRIAIGL